MYVRVFAFVCDVGEYVCGWVNMVWVSTTIVRGGGEDVA